MTTLSVGDIPIFLQCQFSRMVFVLKNEREFLEFNRKHGVNPLSHIYATQGTVLTLLMGAAILCVIAWLCS
jgi:hypothetical protein